MKALARIGALLSFSFFFLPGAILLTHGHDELWVKLFGLCLLGLAFFFGTILWLAGERGCSKPDRN